MRRHHMYDQTFQRAFKRAVEQAGITKPATPHTLRHCSRRPCPQRLRHSNRAGSGLAIPTSTTMIYTHVPESWCVCSALTADALPPLTSEEGSAS
ncbi:tyrosine-type recombinase/integrase [Escherichia coli]